MVCVPDCEPDVLMGVGARALASVVARRKVFASTLITKYVVPAVRPVGSAPVVVGITASPVASPWLLRVTTPGEAIVTVNVPSV
jgi:hypothetical protein